jgi:hypothetical protein
MDCGLYPDAFLSKALNPVNPSLECLCSLTLPRHGAYASAFASASSEVVTHDDAVPHT